MTEPREHHYVPKLLLREFGHGMSRQWLWVYDKHSDKVFRGSVKKSARRRDYYESARADGQTDMMIERVLGILEDDAAPALARLRAVKPGQVELDPSDRHKVAVFMAVQHARVPSVRDAAESSVKLMKAAEMDSRLAAEPELLKEWRKGELEIVPPTGFVQVHLLSSALDVLAPRFFAMRWRLMLAPVFPGLVLGDAPVSPPRPADVADDEWRGFAHPDVDVVLPIGPRHLLVLNGDRVDDSIDVIDDADIPPRLARSWVYEANEATWTRAARHIYGRSRADLEATRLALRPEQPQAVRRLTVKNLRPELAVHARDFDLVASAD
jgi:hypothetical protein